MLGRPTCSGDSNAGEEPKICERGVDDHVCPPAAASESRYAASSSRRRRLSRGFASRSSGFPYTTSHSPTFFRTSVNAPTAAPNPSVTPGRTIDPAPTMTVPPHVDRSGLDLPEPLGQCRPGEETTRVVVVGGVDGHTAGQAGEVVHGDALAAPEQAAPGGEVNVVPDQHPVRTGGDQPETVDAYAAADPDVTPPEEADGAIDPDIVADRPDHPGEFLTGIQLRWGYVRDWVHPGRSLWSRGDARLSTTYSTLLEQIPCSTKRSGAK